MGGFGLSGTVSDKTAMRQKAKLKALATAPLTKANYRSYSDEASRFRPRSAAMRSI